MTASMSVSTLVHLLVLSLLIGIPAWLLYHAYLKRAGLSWRVSAVLSLAGLTVLFSAFTAFWGYSLLRLSLIYGAVIILLLLWWLRNHRQVDHLSTDESHTELPQILLQVFVFAVFLAPAFVLYLPLDTDAQGFGYLALMLREGGTINTLAPWHADVSYLYSPGSFIWWAYLSDLLRLPLHLVMLPFSHITAGFIPLLSIDLASALTPGNQRMRWLMPITITIGMGLLYALLDSHYTAVLALLFTVLFLTLAFYTVRREQITVFLHISAGLALGAVALTHPDTIIILLIGYVPFYVTYWLSRSQQRHQSNWLSLFIFIPAIGVIFTIPWLVQAVPLFFEQSIASPFTRYLIYVVQLVLFQGVLIPLLALGGIIVALRRRWLADIFMLTWTFFVIDFAVIGIADAVIGILGINLARYAYPFSIAWHGPIIPYAYLAAVGIDWLLDWRPIKLSAQRSSQILAIGLGLIMLAVGLQKPLLQFSSNWLGTFGAFSSRADIAAMDYARTHLPPDALLLNYPVGLEGHWVPVISERESIAFREQHFFSSEAEPYYQRTKSLTAVYFHLDNPDAHQLLQDADVTHILYPQILLQPGVFGNIYQMMRWRWPAEHQWRELEYDPAEISWLELIYEQNGARLYRIISEE